MVRSAEDMAAELNTTEEQVRKAADLHGLALPNGEEFDITVETTRLHALVGDIPEDMVSSENPLLSAILYVNKGLSIEEIADVLAEETGNTVNEADVRQALIDVGLLDGLTSEEREYQAKQNRGEINRPRYENGLTVDL